MNIKQKISTVLFWVIFFALTACSNRATDKSFTNQIINDSTSKLNQQTNASLEDSMKVQKDELTKISTL